MTDADSNAKSAAPIAGKLASGAALNFVGMIVLRLMGLINIVIVARLLTPDDFGVMALAIIAVGFTEALINRQFDSALIRQSDIQGSHFNTAFALGLIVGFGGATTIFALAGPLAKFFDTPELEAVLRWLALVPLLIGFKNPYFVCFEKELNFRPALWLNLTSRLVMTIVSVIAAYLIGSYWALVIALLTLHVVSTFLSWRRAPDQPRVGFTHWKAFVNFGGWLTLAGLATFAQRRLPSAILGRFSGTFEAGVFQVGNEISTTMTQQMLSPIGHALYPGLMSVSESPARLRQAYLLGQQSLLGIALPLGVGVAVAAPEVVRVLLGTQWAAAVPIIAILTPVSAMLTLTLGVNAIKMIDGDTRSLFLRNLFVLFITVPLATFGFFWFGIVGLAVGQALAFLVNLALTLQIAARATDTRLIDPLLKAGRSFAAVCAMVLVLLGLDWIVGFDPFSASLSEAVIMLIAQIILSGLTVVLVHFVLWRMAGRPAGFEQQVINLVIRLLERARKRQELKRS